MHQSDVNNGIRSIEPWQRQTLQVLLLLIVSSIVLVAGIGGLTLTDRDETRYTLIGKNMIERSNYMEPWLGDKVYIDKPPLYFWLTAASLKAFGADQPGSPDRLLQFSARIVPVAGALLTILACYLIAAALFNHLLGLISGGVLLSTVALIGFGKYVRMDIYLTAFIALTLWAFIKGYKTETASKWYLLMYPIMALGVLTKGPIAVLIPGAVIFALLAWQRQWAVLGHMRLILGIATIIAVAGPWFLYMGITHEEYIKEFFVDQNIKRFTDGIYGHLKSPLYYLGAMFLGMVPWSGLLILAAARYTRISFAKAATDWESRFLLIWMYFIIVFFSLSETKLVNYVLPAFVPAAILVGRFMYDYWQSDFPRRRRQLSFSWAHPMILAVAAAVVLLYLLAAFGAGWMRVHERWAGLENLYDLTWWTRWGWLISLLYRLILAAILVKVFWFFWRNWQLKQLAIAIGVAFLLLFVDLSYTGFVHVTHLASGRSLVPMVLANSDPGDQMIAGPEERWSLPLYLRNRRSVLQVENTANLLSIYTDSPDKKLYYSTDEFSFNQVDGKLKARVEVLARYNQTRLVLIRQERGTANPEPDQVARKE